MTTDQNRDRLQELRDLPEPRDPALETELVSLVDDLHVAESQKLSDTTQRMRREREEIESRTRSLELLEARRTALLARLENALAEARSERLAIDRELASVLSGNA